MKYATIALIPTLLLTACSTGASNDTRAIRQMVAPDVIQYPEGQRRAVADEIKGGFCPASTELLKDYKVMRGQSRAVK